MLPIEEYNIQDLYKLAEAILQLKKLPVEYPMTSFYSTADTVPEVPINFNVPVTYCKTIPLPDGDVLVEAGIPCRELVGVFDLDSRQVYEAVNGCLFIFVDKNDSKFVRKSYFDYPRLELKEYRDISQVFEQSAEAFTKKLPLMPEAKSRKDLNMVISNKIKELQERAYQQGLNSNYALSSLQS